MNKQEATLEANEWLKTMPEGWKIRVWQNTRWHWALENGLASITPTHDHTAIKPSFICLISHTPAGVGGGCTEWTKWSDKTDHSTPMEAFEYQLGQVREFLTPILKFLQDTSENPNSVRGYMCLIDFRHELGRAKKGNKVYPSVDNLKEQHTPWTECGIVEVEVAQVAVIEPCKI